MKRFIDAFCSYYAGLRSSRGSLKDDMPSMPWTLFIHNEAAVATQRLLEALSKPYKSKESHMYERTA